MAMGGVSKSVEVRHMETIWVRRADLPLVVYREIAAHLNQVEGVQTELIPQNSQQFDYSLSQIDSLRIFYLSDAVSLGSRERVQQVLAYYSDRYGAWTILT
jgi:hypothetical protein